MTSKRLVQGCDVCGQVDDHPRHTKFYPVGEGDASASLQALQKAMDSNISPEALRDMADAGRAVRHFDCCASQGCQVCAKTLHTVGEDLRGPDLIAAITKKG